jgi:hypothetical protein
MIYLLISNTLLIGLVAWREWEHDKRVNQLINGITGRTIMISKQIDRPIRIDPALEKK